MASFHFITFHKFTVFSLDLKFEMEFFLSERNVKAFESHIRTPTNPVDQGREVLNEFYKSYRNQTHGSNRSERIKTTGREPKKAK